MSKLDELIRELCPNGVEHKRIGDFAMCFPGATPKTTHPEYWENGTIPWMSSGEVNQEEVTFTEKKITRKGYEETSTKMVPVGAVVIALAGQGKTRGKVAITRIPLCTNQSLCAIVADKTVISEYLFHYLRSQYTKIREISSGDGTRGGLNLKMIKSYMVPVPPLEIQKEIVRILDTYTEKINELTKELTAEFIARKVQYSYYRDKLLSYNSTTQMEKLGENCEMKAGKAIASSLISDECTEETPIKCYGGNGVRGYVKNANEDGSYPIIGRQGALCGNVKYAEGKFYATEHAVVVKPKEKYNPRFLYHLLTNMNLNQYKSAGAQPGLAVKNIAELTAPVPPLDVQNRIVNVLDNFEKICSDLTIGLPAEIEARQKQYEYYRDKLLTFAEAGGTIMSRAEQSRALIKLVQYVYGCVWLELGDVIVSLNTGLNPRKFFKLNTEDATNYYITIREMKDGKIVPSEKTDRMNDEARKLCNNRSNLEVGDVLFSGTGTIGETAVIEKEPSNWNIKEGVYAIKPNQTMIQPMYLRYILMTDFIKKEYMKKAAGGTVQSVPMGELKKIRIPVPSLQEQNRIVGVLKQLDDLCNDLTSGLPAEIEARQRQYEYYRDKLLTFKERG